MLPKEDEKLNKIDKVIEERSKLEWENGWLHATKEILMKINQGVSLNELMKQLKEMCDNSESIYREYKELRDKNCQKI
jgi:hypothetical protein